LGKVKGKKPGVNRSARKAAGQSEPSNANSALRSRSSFWLPLVTGLLGALIGAFPSYYPRVQDFFRPRFVVDRGGGVHGNPSMFRKWSPARVGWTYQGIDFATFLRITNNSSETTGIEGYKLEARTEDGWKAMRRLQVMYPHAVGSGDKFFDLSANGLDIVASNRLLEPGHSVEGWAFFMYGDVPLNSDLDRLRLTITDTRGNQDTVELRPPNRDDPTNASIEQSGLQVMPKGFMPPGFDPSTVKHLEWE